MFGQSPLTPGVPACTRGGTTFAAAESLAAPFVEEGQSRGRQHGWQGAPQLPRCAS